MDFSNLPPLHPMWVHFPIALIVTSFLCDLLSKIYQSASLRSAGWWTILFAGITAGITVIFGYSDMNRAALRYETHQYVDLHLRIGWLLVIAVAVLVLWRANFRAKPERNIGLGYLFVALLVVGLTLFQGWFGGELVYSQGAGVAATGQGMKSPEEAKRSLAKVKRVFDTIPGFRAAQSPHREEPMRDPAGTAKETREQ